MINKDDNVLVKEIIAGEVRSFEVLIDRYQKMIFNMVLRMVGNPETAKDLSQDIFVKVYENLDHFNFRFRFFSWIYRITINETLTWIKRNPKMQELTQVEQLAGENQYEDEDERKAALLTTGIQSLAPDYQVLLNLKYYQGLSYEEMAEVNGISIEKVRSRLFIAREQLRRILLQEDFFGHE